MQQEEHTVALCLVFACIRPAAIEHVLTQRQPEKQRAPASVNLHAYYPIHIYIIYIYRVTVDQACLLLAKALTSRPKRQLPRRS